MEKIIFALFVLFLVGCSTSPIQPSQSQEQAPQQIQPILLCPHQEACKQNTVESFLNNIKMQRNMDSPTSNIIKVYQYHKTYVIEYADERCTKMQVACTGSMRPTLDCKDTIIVCPIDNENDLHIGDVISYDADTSIWGHITAPFIFHRIVEIGQDDVGKYYITRGDNNYDYDYTWNKLSNDEQKVRFNKIEWKLSVIAFGK
jgi:signal peptidase I